MNPSTRIFATCPETGEPLYTGIQLSVDLFDCLVGIDAPVFCPHCKAIHRWTRHSSF